MQYSPQIILGSPSAGIGSGASQAPQVTVIPDIKSSTEQEQIDTPKITGGTQEQTSTLTPPKKDSLLTYAIIGIAGLAGIYFLKRYLKKRKK